MKRKLICSTSTTAEGDDPDSDSEAFEKFIKNSNPEEKLKSKNSDWNTSHIELRRHLEKNGTLGRFGISHLSLWTDLVLEGTLAGPEEEPDWTKYRHIVQVDPLPKRGFGSTKAINSSSSTQDLITVMMLQQQNRREEEKIEEQRRREEEKRWRELEMRRQERQQDMLTSLLATQIGPHINQLAGVPLSQHDPPVAKVSGT